MASVTGKTSEEIDRLFGETIESVELNVEGQLVVKRKGGQSVGAGSVANSLVNAVINTAGKLILTRRNGETIDAGSVRDSPLNAWPVGSIFMTVVNQDPSALLGGGVWNRWGMGRVPVGWTNVDPEFDSVEETGGAKYHTLGWGEMPVHAHDGYTGFAGQHTHTTSSNTTETPANSYVFRQAANGGVTNANLTDAAGNHQHYFATNNAGAGNPHNNMQPYMVCFMWKRVG